MVTNRLLARRLGKAEKRLRWNRIALIGIIVVCLLAAIVAGANIFSIQAEYEAARNEYASLRRDYNPAADSAVEEGGASQAFGGAGAALVVEQAFAENLTKLNPDYIGWVRIGDTPVDYPVVQGKDNEKYLDTSFLGTRNKAGAIFMDTACADGFDAAHIILYGHNMKDESMFGSLSKYLDKEYHALHPQIQVALPDGNTRVYHILSARVTDVYDAAYQWSDGEIPSVAAGFGAPEGSRRLLTLSTCTNDDPNERLLIHAVQTE